MFPTSPVAVYCLHLRCQAKEAKPELELYMLASHNNLSFRNWKDGFGPGDETFTSPSRGVYDTYRSFRVQVTFSCVQEGRGGRAQLDPTIHRLPSTPYRMAIALKRSALPRDVIPL